MPALARHENLAAASGIAGGREGCGDLVIAHDSLGAGNDEERGERRQEDWAPAYAGVTPACAGVTQGVRP
jgi:hypothetical protein